MDKEILDLFDIYTNMVTKLFAKLDSSNDYEDLFSGSLVLDNIEWSYDFHGEHCLFISNDGITIEGNMYNPLVVDSGFFSNFLNTYPNNLQQKWNFKLVDDLFLSYVEKGFLEKLNNCNFLKIIK